ncbi:DUF4249 domain-containing protein [Litoribacter ruber]|uniref:DUF4249 family protein n=1 Tax=Litoribacter ruber TaxID=702568 RepID=UPI001BDAB218|nr:DUF4249 family protein [Litoribacter ruber]MBT0810658.1 DUF4249 domain-containing protein [Litoribacter ruber]
MNKLALYIVVITALLLTACQEEVFIELDSQPDIPVIEAIWTDAPGLNQVTISYSKDYYNLDENQVERDAEVFIRDEETEQIFPFRFVPQIGAYLPINNQTARIGREYSLHVLMNGRDFYSKGRVLPPPTLDSIAVNYREERLFREEGYYLTLYGDIPFETENNYRIRIVRNDTLLNRRNDYLLFDDTFGTQILNRGFELNGYAFKENDRVRLELFRLNRDAYDYLNELVGLLFNDGGLFSPPPQNPTSNIRELNENGEVLGYFKCSSVLSSIITIGGAEN